jgi:diketogulonate reductase-like aldo/keto reductase
MRSLAALAVAGAAAALIPTTEICNPKGGACYQSPTLHEGTCCGTWNVSSWLSTGAIGIDTSVDYGSQPAIAQQIAASGIPRESLWITSKLNVEDISTNMTQRLYEGVLDPLNTTYVDLLLIHHAGRLESDNSHGRPACFDASLAGPAGPGSYYNCRLQAVPALQALVAQGLIRTWGEWRGGGGGGRGGAFFLRSAHPHSRMH